MTELAQSIEREIVQRSSAFWKVDMRWPKWAIARFKAEYFFQEEVGFDLSEMTWHPHSVFKTRPEEIILERSDRRSTVIISDGEKTIGEAWLRLALGLNGSPLNIQRVCEMYSYRRGFRDKLTADMDDQPPGYFVVPNREADLFCSIKAKNRQIILQVGTFCIKLTPNHN